MPRVPSLPPVPVVPILGICDEIGKIVDPRVRGDPESEPLWTSKILVNMRNILNAAGHAINDVTVGKVLRTMGYTQPVISVDTKKKECVGNFKNAGRDYHPKGDAPRAEVHDFVTEAGRATSFLSGG